MLVDEQRATRPIYLMLLTICAFYNTSDWVFALPFASLFAAAILYERVLTHWMFWTLVTSLLGISIGRLWLSEGNHLFFLFYVSLIALVASHTDSPRSVFRLNARYMIGVVFGLATFWKLISNNFTSGLFYSHLLVTDDRLGIVGLLFTKLSRSDILANRLALTRVLDTPVELISYPEIQTLAVALTWSTLAVEAAVAIVFLVDTDLARRLRSPILLAFLLGTYIVIPVPSFGTILACLGYAETRSKFYQKLFLMAFIFMPLTALRYYLLPV